MTNEIVKKSFVFNGTQIRTAIIDGEPWFVAKDVCEVLGIVDNTTAVRDLENDELTRILCVSGGQRREVNAVSESGLYALIFKSRKSEAKAFRKWVTSEVLPTLRKTGKYEMQKVSSESVQPPLPGEIVAREFKAMHELAKLCEFEGNQALLKADKAVKKLHNISPLALLEVELKSPDNEALLIATEIGKRIDPPISAKNVNLILADMKLQERIEYRAGKFEWRLTEKGKAYGSYLDTGKVHSNGTPIQQIKWKESIIPLVQKHSDSL